MIRALIADDEPLARRTLRDLVASLDWMTCVGETADGRATVEAIDTLKPDLVFLDIRMPELSGVEVMETVAHTPRVIFTTAYDKYAIKAFELNALDYLLKPFGRRRFLKAVERIWAPQAPPEAAVPQPADRTAGLTRLFIRHRNRIIPLGVDRIERFEAYDDYVKVYTEGRVYLAHVRLRDLANQMNPQRFVRVHRSHLVNLHFVEAMQPHDAGRLQLRMQNGDQVIASRSGTRRLRRIVKPT